MNLVIDTAQTHCGVGLFEDQHLVALQNEALSHSHAAILPNMVSNVVQDFSRIRNIIINVGPGSFTGIRVGVAYAKGLARGLDIPLFGINSFQAFAQALSEEGLILVDAKRKDLYGQRIFGNGDFSESFNLTPQEIADRFDLNTLNCIGNGIPQLENELGIQLKTVETAQTILELINSAFLKGLADPKTEPYYLRSADVTVS